MNGRKKLHIGIEGGCVHNAEVRNVQVAEPIEKPFMLGSSSFLKVNATRPTGILENLYSNDTKDHQRN